MSQSEDRPAGEAVRSLAIGVVIAVAIISVGLLTGVLTIVNRFPAVSSAISSMWSALGSSVVFFSLDLAAYLVSLTLLARALRERRRESAGQLSSYNNLFINLFFGIGVIYTAIGMQGALSNALGGLEQSSMQTMTAWEILDRLIHGGIITALMTTIVGGVGGYVMRLGRQAAVGRLLQRAEAEDREQVLGQVVGLLEEIRDAVRGRPASGVE